MITLKSHGFKFARPEANVVFDVSYFKNPWREEAIKNETDPKRQGELAIEFMNSQEGVKNFVKYVAFFLEEMDTQFPKENIQVAFCCSAGEYRSPVIAHLVSERLNMRHIEHKIIQSPNSKI